MTNQRPRISGRGRPRSMCSRCGVELSRGYVTATSPPGGLVCVCCDWFDDVERQRWAAPDPQGPDARV